MPSPDEPPMLCNTCFVSLGGKLNCANRSSAEAQTAMLHATYINAISKTLEGRKQPLADEAVLDGQRKAIFPTRLCKVLLNQRLLYCLPLLLFLPVRVARRRGKDRNTVQSRNCVVKITLGRPPHPITIVNYCEQCYNTQGLTSGILNVDLAGIAGSTCTGNQLSVLSGSHVTKLPPRTNDPYRT